MRYLILALLVIPFGASAQMTRVPSGDGVYQSVVLNVDVTQFLTDVGVSSVDEYCNVYRNDGPYSYWTVGFTVDGGAYYAFPQQADLNNPISIFTYTAQPGDFFPVTQILANCGDASGTLASLEYTGSVLFTLDFTATNPPTNIWGSNSGFWGDDFSTVDIKDSLQASVQATGVSIWPLLYLAGVPLAFAIAYYLLDFLYYSIYLGQTSKISSQSPYLDKMVYRPYKGYNRLRSRAWNRANTLK